MNRPARCPYCFRVSVIGAAALVFVILMLQPSRFAISELPFVLYEWTGEPGASLDDLAVADDARWQPLPPRTDGLGFRQPEVWLRLTLPRQLQEAPALVFSAPYIDYLDVYRLTPGSAPELLAAVGDQRPFFDRPVLVPQVVIPLPADINANDELLLYVANDGALLFPLILAPSMDAVLGSYSAQLYFHGLMSGIFLFTAMLAIAMGLTLRRSAELLFAGLIISILGVQAELNGVLYAFLWPTLPQLNIAIFPGTMAAAIFGATFTLLFLNTNKQPNRLNGWILKGWVVVLCLLLVTWFINHFFLGFSGQRLVQISQIVAALVGVSMVVEGIRASLRGSEKGQIFLAAMLLIITGACLLFARSAGLLPDSLLTGSALEVGAVLAVIILTGAVIRETYLEKTQRIDTQKALIEQEEKNAELQNKMIRQALTNDILGLPNRQSLVMFLDKHTENKACLILIEFRHYHNIERTMGVSVANDALVSLASRLKLWIANQRQQLAYPDHPDQLYAVQDNVMGILVTKDSVKRLLASLRVALEPGVSIGNFEVDMSPVFASIDCQKYGMNAEGSVLAALASLDRVVISPDHLAYEPAHQQEGRDKLFLLSALASAIDQSDLELYLQPVMNLDDDSVPAAEVLLRWNHTVLGEVSPAVFVPLAEETGIITRLTLWLAGEVCRVHHELRAAGIDIGLSINISAEDLAHPETISRVLSIARERTGGNLRLKLELTETAVMRSGNAVRQSVDMIKASGLGFSIDDFGAGHSSLSRIHELPVNELKIDRSILEQALNRQEFSVLESAIGLARSLKLRVVAEGVSSQEQLTLLRRLNVDAVQGFLIARPIPVSEFIEWYGRR
ncbi:EAL domain-containing protein [Salinispirillum sp. LH 10-3-1]|uniref:EAL domain-containing protein n=1 Tax=Salinispirillum sp. LH 10-3-1 TaxID=2952525 RepID=A0AB38YIY1_9GAMM